MSDNTHYVNSRKRRETAPRRSLECAQPSQPREDDAMRPRRLVAPGNDSNRNHADEMARNDNRAPLAIGGRRCGGRPTHARATARNMGPRRAKMGRDKARAPFQGFNPLGGVKPPQAHLEDEPTSSPAATSSPEPASSPALGPQLDLGPRSRRAPRVIEPPPPHLEPRTRTPPRGAPPNRRLPYPEENWTEAPPGNRLAMARPSCLAGNGDGRR